MMIASAGKLIVFIGLGLVVFGAALWLFGRLFPNFRGLPGDIRYESDNVRIYNPHRHLHCAVNHHHRAAVAVAHDRALNLQQRSIRRRR